MMVLSAWSVLVVLGCYGVVCLVSFGCYYGVVCLVRLGGFGLKIDQTVLFVWSILDCHDSVCLVSWTILGYLDCSIYILNVI